MVRKPLDALKPKEYGVIRDPRIREAVRVCLEKAKIDGVKPEKALVEFGLEHGVKSVRILIKDQTVDPVPSAPYKGYKADSYVCCDIWRLPKGKRGKWKKGEFQWQGVFWTYVETASGVPEPGAKKPYHVARFVTRLFKNDLVAYEDGGVTRVTKVAGFSTTNNKLDLKPHNIADSARNYISINVLGGGGLRRLHVSPDGHVRNLKRLQP